MTYNEVYDISVPLAKRTEEANNYFISKFVRPLSIVFTMLLAPSNIHPITITQISIGCLVVGTLVLSYGASMPFKILGWMMFFAWGVLDCVDGNLARYNNMCSKMGELWDTVGGYSALVLMNLSAGIAAYYDVHSYEFCGKHSLLIFSGITSVAAIFPRLVTQKKRNLRIEDISVQRLLDKTTFDGWKNLAMNIVSPLGFMQPLFLIAIITHTLNLFVVFYMLANVCVMAISLRSLLRG